MKDVLVFVGFFAFVAVFITLVILAEKKRQRRLREACEAAGVTIVHGAGVKDKDAAARLFAFAGLMRELRTGAKGVSFAGLARAGEREVTFIEHSYTTGSGKSQRTVRHSLAAIPAPPQWPELRISPEGIFRKLAELVGQKDVQLENPEFNDRWRVKTADEDFAIVLLSPEVQARMMEWPKEYWAAIGGGAIAIVTGGHLTAERLTLMLRLVTELGGLIPPEVAMWGLDINRAEGATDRGR